MSQFPDGLEIANGRFRLAKLVRGTASDGLWTATDRAEHRDVWVTIRHARHTQARAQKLDFQAFGIAAPLFIGPPDLYSPGGEGVRDAHVCVVDSIPDGEALGRLTTAQAIDLGASLCNVVGTWARVMDGYVLRGLRPETIFVSRSTQLFTGATPRPYFLLGNQNEFDAYPSLSFDPPALGPYEIEKRDAVFTIGLLVWWAATGIHPYVVRGTDTMQNQLDDRRLPFDGAPELGQLLERALVADPDARITLEALEDAFTRETARSPNRQAQ